MKRIVVLASILCSCTPAEPAPAPREAEPVEPAPTKAEAPVAVAPKPVVVAEPVAPPTVATPQLFPVVRGETKLQLFATTDGSLFVTANAEPMRIPDEGPIVREPRLVAGIDDPGRMGMLDWRTTALGGTWPNDMHMTVEADGERWSAQPGVYRFNGNAWQRVANVKGGLAWMYRDFAPWTDGATLALRGWVSADREGEDENEWDADYVSAFEKKLERAAPRELEVLGGAGKGPRFGEAKVMAFASLPIGDVVVITENESLHWAPGAATPEKHVIDPALSGQPELQMNAADDVWMTDGDGLRRFDGKAWQKVATPRDTHINGIATTSDGRTWIVQGERYEYSADDNDLYVREGDGEWREVSLPKFEFPNDAKPHFVYYGTYDFEPADPDQIGVKQPLVAVDLRAHRGELWIVARGPSIANYEGHRWALLHTKDRGGVLELSDPETLRREMLDGRPAAPFRGDRLCDVFVPMTPPAVEGAHDDVRDALQKIEALDGVTLLLVEATHQGKPALGVVLPSDVAPNPKAMKTATVALEKALPDRAGTPVCKSMRIDRVLATSGG